MRSSSSVSQAPLTMLHLGWQFGKFRLRQRDNYVRGQVNDRWAYATSSIHSYIWKKLHEAWLGLFFYIFKWWIKMTRPSCECRSVNGLQYDNVTKVIIMGLFYLNIILFLREQSPWGIRLRWLFHNCMAMSCVQIPNTLRISCLLALSNT